MDLSFPFCWWHPIFVFVMKITLKMKAVQCFDSVFRMWLNVCKTVAVTVWTLVNLTEITRNIVGLWLCFSQNEHQFWSLNYLAFSLVFQKLIHHFGPSLSSLECFSFSLLPITYMYFSLHGKVSTKDMRLKLKNKVDIYYNLLLLLIILEYQEASKLFNETSTSRSALNYWNFADVNENFLEP